MATAARIRVRTNPEFAELAGIAPTTASRIRNGHRVPSRETVQAIIAGFQLTGSVAQRCKDAYLTGGNAFAEFVRKELFEADVEHDELAEV
jgi:transcriptional regulator with XRE-family HTH domain